MMQETVTSTFLHSQDSPSLLSLGIFLKGKSPLASQSFKVPPRSGSHHRCEHALCC